MISHEHKCIFIHILKTGGVSIASSLGMERTNCHLTSTEIKNLFPPDIWSSYFKFTIIRNPYDKMVSQYHYNGIKLFPGSNFKQYLQYIKSGVRVTKWPLRPCTGYICDDIDYIGRFENLQQSYDYICNKINKPMHQLPQYNKSNHDHYSKYYDEECISIVKELFKTDLDRFGYTFEEQQ